MKSLSYHNAQVSDKNIHNMSINWKDLTSLVLLQCTKYHPRMSYEDNGLASFRAFQVSEHRFEKIQYSSGVKTIVKLDDISQLFDYSDRSLKSLNLALVFSSDDITRLIVNRFHQLEYLSLRYENDFNMELDCDNCLLTDHLIKSIAQYLPKLKLIDINILEFDPDCDVSDASIAALVHGCPMLHTMRMQLSDLHYSFPIPERITKASYELIAKNLYKTIRNVALEGSMVAQVSLMDLKGIFKDCWQDVYVNHQRMHLYEPGRTNDRRYTYTLLKV
jgi:hypothetical protein